MPSRRIFLLISSKGAPRFTLRFQLATIPPFAIYQYQRKLSIATFRYQILYLHSKYVFSKPIHKNTLLLCTIPPLALIMTSRPAQPAPALPMHTENPPLSETTKLLRRAYNLEINSRHYYITVVTLLVLSTIHYGITSHAIYCAIIATLLEITNRARFCDDCTLANSAARAALELKAEQLDMLEKACREKMQSARDCEIEAKRETARARNAIEREEVRRSMTWRRWSA